MAHRDGLLLIDKPEGMTSHDVVDRLRRALRMKRIGHSGTLDPMATGVLVLCLGKATRLQRFFTGCDKEYIARIRLGFATDSHDRTGKPLSPIIASKGVMKEQLQQVMDSMHGPQEQLPPMFSAKKQAGTRLYKLARQGKDVQRKPVPIRIDAIELLAEEGEYIHQHRDGTSDFSILVRCSAGTYIRSMAHDIGVRLGCGGHITALRRTAVGSFRIERAVALEEFEQLSQPHQAQEHIIPLTQIPLDMPIVALTAAEVQQVRKGQSISRARSAEATYCKLVDRRGNFVAVGEISGSGGIQPRIVLY